MTTERPKTEATRETILAAVGHVFDTPPVFREDLVTAAMQSGAPQPLVMMLDNLPIDGRIHQIRDVWKFLPDIAITDSE
ncbi:DUF2795 domain-containing protein [Cryobacterium sp. Y57]|jgi:hypothetical protein|uniref:DUF2795 domain-containing protein n=1 Tax=Cryobacterium sp. Y57 TaxID=2048287 RepID=UPI000CE45A89|nr:DUF2795 domain-containing protein [Cryobacterium sp. Y57]